MSPFRRRNLEFRAAEPTGRARGAAPALSLPSRAGIRARRLGFPWRSGVASVAFDHKRQGGRATHVAAVIRSEIHWKGGARGVRRKRSS